MDEQFQDFVSDPRLRKALERLKRSTEIFDIIDPDENQHSEILKWLFDPREGHGQGDAIFKDFLTAAYASAADNVWCNKEFFSVWTPSKIDRTGFHSIISFREYYLPEKSRLDLLMVDCVNQIIVVIENKHGAKLGDTQLEKYYDQVGSSIRSRAAFNGYKTAHIVLDRNYAGSTEENEGRGNPFNRWSFLDYQWLEAGAERASFQIRRGNQSAALVIAYCQKQTDYVPPEEKELDDDLADISKDYRDLISELEEVLSMDVANLTPSMLSSIQGEKWIFANHYRELIERLGAKNKLSHIETHIKKHHPQYKIEAEYAKRKLWLFDTTWKSLSANGDEYWPLCVTAWERLPSKFGPGDYALAVQYRQTALNSEYKEAVEAMLEKEFPEIKKGPQSAERRTLGKEVGISEEKLAVKAQALYLRLKKALRPIVNDPT